MQILPFSLSSWVSTSGPARDTRAAQQVAELRNGFGPSAQGRAMPTCTTALKRYRDHCFIAYHLYPISGSTDFGQVRLHTKLRNSCQACDPGHAAVLQLSEAAGGIPAGDHQPRSRSRRDDGPQAAPASPVPPCVLAVMAFLKMIMAGRVASGLRGSVCRVALRNRAARAAAAVPSSLLTALPGEGPPFAGQAVHAGEGALEAP